VATSDDRVVLSQALDPLVLAIDVGSTASRGDVFDAAGRPVQGGRRKIRHQFTTGGDGRSEIDPDQIVGEVEQIISALATDQLAGRIGGVSMDTFASSLVGVDAQRRARTPCFTYADSRCGAQVSQLRRELDEPVVQQRTGCRLHASYLTPRLRWLRDETPDTFASVRRWMSLGEYVHLRLLGATAAGTSTAAWTGMLDRRTGRWDPELLAAGGVTVEQMSEIRHPDQPITEVDPAVASRWPALTGAAWFPVIFSNNLGAGAHDESAIAAAATTSGAMRVLVHRTPEEIPSGLWCYRVDSDRSLLGGAVNDVGRVVSWLQTTLQLSPARTPTRSWPPHRRRSPPSCCRTSPENAAPAGRPTHEHSSPGSPRPQPGRCSTAPRWRASRSRTPGSRISFRRLPVGRNGSWQAGGSPPICRRCCSCCPTCSKHRSLR
jgi:gluconokinase